LNLLMMIPCVSVLIDVILNVFFVSVTRGNPMPCQKRQASITPMATNKAHPAAFMATFSQKAPQEGFTALRAGATMKLPFCCMASQLLASCSERVILSVPVVCCDGVNCSPLFACCHLGETLRSFGGCF